MRISFQVDPIASFRDIAKRKIYPGIDIMVQLLVDVSVRLQKSIQPEMSLECKQNHHAFQGIYIYSF